VIKINLGFFQRRQKVMKRRRKIGFWIFIIIISLFSISSLHAQTDYTLYFKPLPERVDNPDNPLNPAKIKLGKMLYFDPRLSKSGFISCNSCHNLASGGVDNLPTSIGHKWNLGPRNAPTVFNAALHVAQFWDGRAKDVEEQAEAPIINPGEMAATKELVLKRLRSIPEYVELFKKAFPEEKDPLNYKNIARAIGAFERTLMTPSRFDEFLKGNRNALTPIEKKGLELFVNKGCVGCHNGVGIGGGMFQRFDYGTDLGRYEVTKKESDKKVFKVPSLRNVALTYPYFHDGSVWDLREAVRIMGKKQLGTDLSKSEIDYIVAFLKSLTGTNLEYTLPVLPPSRVNTPRPDVK